MRLIATVLFCLLAASAYAQLYKCEKDGKTTYQEMPCSGGKQSMLGASKSAASPATELQQFADVPTDSSFFYEINNIYQRGITDGCSKDPKKYCPNADATRGQTAMLLLRAKFSPEETDPSYIPPPYKGIFIDVPEEHFAARYIEELYHLGITAGCSSSPKKYCPNDPVKRSHIAVFLLRTLHGQDYSPPQATGEVFIDVPKSHKYAGWAEALYNEDMAASCSNSKGIRKFCPHATVSRDQMAQFITLMLNKM